MTTSNGKRHYGWHPSRPDQRDLLFAAGPIDTLPSRVDLREGCTPVYEQGALGSCTANAISAALDFERLRQKQDPIPPSRLFIYYNERAMEGTVASDSGAALRDGIKSVAKQGACPEPEWPYEIGRFAQRPPDQCYVDARRFKALQYLSVPQSMSQLKGCLAAGFPYVFGFSVYESLESPEVANSGRLNMPAPSEAMMGGHAVMCVGYDDFHQHFIVRNSWGKTWGQLGYFTMPYAYQLSQNLAADFWTIRAVM